METRKLSFEEMENLEGGKTVPCWLQTAALLAGGVVISAAMVEGGIGILGIPAWGAAYATWLSECMN